MLEFIRRLYPQGVQAFYQEMDRSLAQGEKRLIVTANAETMMIAERNQQLHTILSDPQTTIVPDGVSCVKGANMAGIPLQERITGVDLVQHLLQEGGRQNKSVFFFGAKEEVLQALAKRLEAECPGLAIVGLQNGYVSDRNAVVDRIVQAQPDLIFLALGIPAQEILLYEMLPRLSKGILVGVGGSLDVLSGTKRRAPKKNIKHNCEWLYRILKEPSRLKRFYDNNVRFFFQLKREMRKQDEH